jgi:hypothetical protein
MDANFIWGADNLLIGGLFGGSAVIIKKMFNLVEDVFVNEMVAKGNVNNEQLALALIWKKSPELFFLIKSSPYFSLYIFKLLSMEI